jgi:hypothetical protein
VSFFFSCYFLSFLLSFLLLLFLALKGVTYGNLIRLGLFWGKGAAAHDKGAFGSGWGCYPKNDIQNLHTTLLKALKGEDFGPFDSLSLLIGDRNARIICLNHLTNCFVRPPPTAGQPPSQVVNFDDMVIDIDD